jgi:hypothetical protein
MMQKTGLLLTFFLTLSVVTKAQIPYTNCPGCWNPDSLGQRFAPDAAIAVPKGKGWLLVIR